MITLKDLKKYYKKINRQILLVGIIKPTKHKDSTLSVAEIGAIHEFGLGHVPKRSFIRDYFRYHMKRFNSLFRKLLAIRDQNLFENLGLDTASGIQERIARGIWPPLANRTKIYKKNRFNKGTPKKKRKSKDTPLIATGQLRSSITYKVIR